MRAITTEALAPELATLAGQTLYLHLETTAGAYTAGGFGAFIRNAKVRVEQAVVRGEAGRFRVGVRIDGGWAYAEGLTDWERDDRGRLLMAGYDDEGRLTVACELSPTPFRAEGTPRRLAPAVAEGPAGLTPPSDERAVVVVLAHPDDETFGSGGTVARYAHGGVPVTCVCATTGEMGRNMGKPSFATRETLRDLRATELEAACAALGVRDLRLLGVWDKTVEFRDPDALADRIAPVLAEVRPSLVLTHHPVHGVHPDHCAVGAATIRAVRRLPAAERPRVQCMMPRRIADERGMPVESVDIAGAAAEAKLAATRAHRSQSERFIKRLDADPAEMERRRAQMSRENYVVYPVEPV